MNEWREKLNRALQKLKSTGFFSVFLSSVLCQVFSFLGGMVVVRVLSKSDYGLYVYVKNCYSMLFIMNDLGCAVAAMQFCNETYREPKHSAGFFYYGLSRGVLFSQLSGLLMLFSPLFYPYTQQGTAKLVQMLCLAPALVTANAFITTNLRTRLKNKKFARLNIFTTVCNYVAIIPMACWFGVTGAVLSIYVIQLTVLAFGLWESRGELPELSSRTRLSKREKKEFLHLGIASQVSCGLDAVLMLLDVFLIGIFIPDIEVMSSYKVATTIPSALAFIPSAVMIYIVPYFSRHLYDTPWIRSSCKKLFAGLAAFNFLIVVGGVVLSPLIISLVFGSQYQDAVPCFCVLLLGYWFSGSFQMPAGNILYTQRKVKANITVSVMSGISNCILDVVLILNFGSIGAAWATTLVRMIASGLNLSFLYFMVLRKNKRNEIGSA